MNNNVLHFAKNKNPKKKPSSKPSLGKGGWLLVAALVSAGLYYAFSGTPTGLHVKGFNQMEPQDVTAVSITDEQGNGHSLSEFQNQVTLVHFWATWCTPCIAELPDLNRLQQELGGEGVHILPISVDSDKDIAALRQFYTAHGLNALPLYTDRQNLAFRTLSGGGSAGLPTTFILNREAKLVASGVGAKDWNRKDIRNLLQHYSVGE